MATRVVTLPRWYDSNCAEYRPLASSGLREGGDLRAERTVQTPQALGGGLVLGLG